MTTSSASVSPFASASGEVLTHLVNLDLPRKGASPKCILGALRRAPEALAALAAAIGGDAGPLEALSWGPQDVPAVDSYRAERYGGPRGRVFVTRRCRWINDTNPVTTLWVDRLPLVSSRGLERAPWAARQEARAANRAFQALYERAAEGLVALFAEGHDVSFPREESPPSLIGSVDGQKGGAVWDRSREGQGLPVVSARGLARRLEAAGLIEPGWDENYPARTMVRAQFAPAPRLMARQRAGRTPALEFEMNAWGLDAPTPPAPAQSSRW